jgi:pimeloyl-ACP methyl ester carboxylesterase
MFPTMHLTTRRPASWRTPALLAAAGIAASFLYVQAKKHAVERDNPPAGKFVDVDGVRLHYLERGEGPVLVLLHGNGLFANDFELSGLLEQAAQNHHVIAFDRPGFGYSERPSDTSWTPEAQAKLIYQALHRLRIERPIVVGHSWGTLVALAMALDFPKYVRGVALMSGYFFPSGRIDAPLASVPAVPVLGHLLRYTVAPLMGRMMWPALVKRMFGPATTPERFKRLPVWMSLRPSQLGASAAESGLMIPAAQRLSQRYAELTMPVAVIAGSGDRIASAEHHAVRLHEEIPHSELVMQPGVGHMVHYANPDRIMAAVEKLEAEASPGAPA